MAKNNRKGQAAIWTPALIRKMRSRITAPQQRLIFEISLWTGERMGAITQLRVSDVYDERGKVKTYLTFRGETRKSNRWGAAKDRVVKVHDDLRYHLANYRSDYQGYLFPSRGVSGHITQNAVDKYWRAIFNDLGIEGYSTHSSRRWVINQLARDGVTVRVIAELMGMAVQTVYHYLDRDPEACDRAIGNLKVA